MGMKMIYVKYRVNGRMTPAEERDDRKAQIKSAKHSIADKKVTPEKEYEELKAIFFEYGWSAFDKEMQAHFDELRAKYGEAVIDGGEIGAFKTTFDIKPSVQARRDEDAFEAANKRSVLDNRGPSRTESVYMLRSRPSGANVTVLGDGIGLAKVRNHPDEPCRDISGDEWAAATKPAQPPVAPPTEVFVSLNIVPWRVPLKILPGRRCNSIECRKGEWVRRFAVFNNVIGRWWQQRHIEGCPLPLTLPSQFRAIKHEYDLKYPPKENPDSKLFPRTP